MTTLRSRNGNCVAALQPAPGDLFVVTMLGARVLFVQSSDDYERALRVAQRFADVTPPRDRPFTVKVMGMSLDEALAFIGVSRDDFAAGIEITDPDLRRLALSTCKDLLCRSDDAAVRADAMKILTDMGAI